MTKSSVLLLVCIMMTACSVKKEGIALGSVTYEFGSIDHKRCSAKSCPKEVILIGEVSAYRDLGNDSEREYEKYQKAAKKFLATQPISMDKSQFDSSIKGWTNLQVFYIPLVIAGYTTAIILKNEEEIHYPSTIETFLVQGTGDLVFARSNSDGVFVIEKRLCNSKFEFSKCRKRYSRGIYSAASGLELDRKFIKKKKGKKIDLRTYEVLKHH